MAIVPDNLKSAVTRSDRNEPVINEEFAAVSYTHLRKACYIKILAWVIVTRLNICQNY